MSCELSARHVGRAISRQPPSGGFASTRTSLLEAGCRLIARPTRNRALALLD